MAWCEEKGFEGAPAYGPTYEGWIGVSTSNWNGVCAGLNPYSVADNIACGNRIEGGYVPDQGGCSGGW